MEQKKSIKKPVAAAAALVVVIAALLCVYYFTRPDTSAGQKQITLDVVHRDGSVKTFTYQTDAEYLGEVLKAESVVVGEEGPYGLFITEADGEKAEEDSQEWWCLTKDGGQVNTSADQTPIADGEKYELTLTTGY